MCIATVCHLPPGRPHSQCGDSGKTLVPQAFDFLHFRDCHAPLPLLSCTPTCTCSLSRSPSMNILSSHSSHFRSVSSLLAYHPGFSTSSQSSRAPYAHSLCLRLTLFLNLMSLSSVNPLLSILPFLSSPYTCAQILSTSQPPPPERPWCPLEEPPPSSFCFGHSH